MHAKARKELRVGVKRQSFEMRRRTSARIFERDGWKCTRCGISVVAKPRLANSANCDHIRAGLLGTNHDTNLRTLCRRCHVLRLDHRHRGMIAKALEDGIIPPNWRELTWGDE